MPDIAWANGGGATRLLWADSESMRRISIAVLTKPETFSVLPEMLRTLIVLDAIVIVLEVDGRTVELKRGDQVNFLGRQEVAVRALDGPGRVLNVMGRSPFWKPCVRCGPTDGMPIGWMATDEIHALGTILQRGDLVLGRRPPTGTLGIGFLSGEPCRREGRER